MLIMVKPGHKAHTIHHMSKKYGPYTRGYKMRFLKSHTGKAFLVGAFLFFRPVPFCMKQILVIS